jgi:hypothetical protein
MAGGIALNEYRLTRKSPEVVDWHCRQAAEHFVQSNHHLQTAPMRLTARRRFLADARHALPTLGLNAFLATFRQHLFQRGDVRHFEDAQPIITALAAELALVPRAQPVAGVELPDVTAALVKAKDALATALAQVGEALRMAEGPGVSGEAS